MRSLKIPIKRYVNNLINQNQKLSSDFVMNQSTTVSNVQSTASGVQSPAEKLQRPESRVQHPESSVQYLRPAASNSSVPKNPSNILRLKKTYDLKTP